MMAVMVMLYTTVLSTKMKNADGWSGHGGGEAEGPWILHPSTKLNLTRKVVGLPLGSKS